MAFGFFRRRQKLVIVIMAVLMVSFLIGIQGLETVLEKKGGDVVLGQSRYGKVKVGDLWSAKTDMYLVGQYIGIGDRRRMPQWRFLPWTTGLEFAALQENGNDADLAYVLLQADAKNAGVAVNDLDVDGWFSRLGIDVKGAQYKATMSALKSNEQGITEKRFREAVAGWLAIYRAFEAAQVSSPASTPELELLYRDLGERIDLRVLRVLAEDFVKDAPAPAELQIVEQFGKLKDVVPGEPAEDNPFGFGYKQPDRVQIEYLLVNQDVVERVARPSGKQMREYFREHAAEFAKKVPISSTQPASIPASAPASQPATAASQPVEYREEPKTYAEAREEIAEILSRDAVQLQLDRIVALVEDRAAKQPAAGGGGYAAVAESLKGDAKDALAVKVDLAIQAQRLDRAVEIVAEQADLNAICYPWNAGGKLSVDPGVRVTLEAKGITVGEALARITQQAFAAQPTTQKAEPEGGEPKVEAPPSPQVQWATCGAMPGVLFPVGPADLAMFPLEAGQTDRVDWVHLRDDALLRHAFTSQGQNPGQRLGLIAFSAEAFNRPKGVPALVKVGETGPRMFVESGGRTGRLVWKLAEAVPSHAPESLTEELRKQVVEDLKIAAAFDLAGKQAETWGKSASASGLEAVAKEAKKDTSRTGLFSRKTLIASAPDGRVFAAPGPFSAKEKAQYLQQLILTGYFSGVELEPSMTWSGAAGLSLLTEKAREQFVKAAFALAPKNVEPPYPAQPPAVAVLPLRSDRSVVIIERAEFQPLVVSEYETQDRLVLAQFLQENQRDRVRSSWFNVEEVKRRTGYQPAEP